MTSGASLGDLPSWILVLLIGFGVVYASSEGLIPGYGELGRLMIVAGIGLGVFYFATDISNKL